jgi:hypothetical protein
LSYRHWSKAGAKLRLSESQYPWIIGRAKAISLNSAAKVIQKNEMPKVFDKKLKNTCSYHRF